jgi:hypothetical protein
MSIKYFPNRVFKKSVPAIDRVMAKKNPRNVSGCANVSANALSAIISSDVDWQINSVKFAFSNTAPRNYSAKILNGIKVVTNLNDYLWFQTPNTLWQQITLDAGFYTGTELATQLQTKLNANVAFTDLGLTFTVVYDGDDGSFTITPSSGTVKYIQQNNTQRLPIRDSIAGHLFGLTVSTDFVSSIVSDTKVFGLGQEVWFIDETGKTVLEHYNNDIHILDIDQALHIETNVANTTVNYSINFEELT